MLSVINRVSAAAAVVRARYQTLAGSIWLGWLMRYVLPAVLGSLAARTSGLQPSGVACFWFVISFLVLSEYLLRGAVAFALPMVLYVASCFLFLLSLCLPVFKGYVSGLSESIRLLTSSRYPGFLFVFDDVWTSLGDEGRSISWWMVAFLFVVMLVYLSLDVDWYDDLQHYLTRRFRSPTSLWFISASLLVVVLLAEMAGIPGGLGHLVAGAVSVGGAVALTVGGARMTKYARVAWRLVSRRDKPRAAARSAETRPAMRRAVAPAVPVAAEPARAAPVMSPDVVAEPLELNASQSVEEWGADVYDVPDDVVVDLSTVVVVDPAAVRLVDPVAVSALAAEAVPPAVETAAIGSRAADLPQAGSGERYVHVPQAAAAGPHFREDVDVIYDRSEEDPEAQAVRVLNYVISAMDMGDWSLMDIAAASVTTVWRMAYGIPTAVDGGDPVAVGSARRENSRQVLAEIWRRPLGEDFIRAMNRFSDLDALNDYLYEQREGGSDLSVRTGSVVDMALLPYQLLQAGLEPESGAGGSEPPRSPRRDLPPVPEEDGFDDLGHEAVDVRYDDGHLPALVDDALPAQDPPGVDDMAWASPAGHRPAPVDSSPVRFEVDPGVEDEPTPPRDLVRQPTKIPPVGDMRGHPVMDTAPGPVPAAVDRAPVHAEAPSFRRADLVRVSEPVSYVVRPDGAVGPEDSDEVDVEEVHDGNGPQGGLRGLDFHVSEGVTAAVAVERPSPVARFDPPRQSPTAAVPLPVPHPGRERPVGNDPARVVTDLSMDDLLSQQQPMDVPQIQAILQADDDLSVTPAAFAQRFRTRLVSVGFDQASLDGFLNYVGKMMFHYSIDTGDGARSFLFGLVDLFPTSAADKAGARERMAYVFCETWRRETHAIVERLLNDPGASRRADATVEEIDQMIRTMERMGRIFISDPSAQSQFSLRVDRLRDVRARLFGDGPARAAADPRIDEMRAGAGLALRGDLDHPAQTDLDDFLSLAEGHTRIEDMIARESLYSGREALEHPLQMTLKDLQVQGGRILARLSAAADRLRDKRKMPRTAPVLDRLLDGLGDVATLFRQIVERQREELADDFVPTSDRVTRLEAEIEGLRQSAAAQRLAETKGLRERVEAEWAASSGDPFSAISRRLAAQAADAGAVSSEWRMLDLVERSVGGLRVFSFDHGNAGDRVILIPLFGLGVGWSRRGEALAPDVDGISSFDLRSFVRAHRAVFGGLRPSDVKVLLFAGELSRNADPELLSSRLPQAAEGTISSDYARLDADWWRGVVVLRGDLVGQLRGVERKSGMAGHLKSLLAEPRDDVEVPA